MSMRPPGAIRAGRAPRTGRLSSCGELLRLFEMQKKLDSEAQTDNERALTAELLQDMEQISRQAHEAVGFTYIPLEQLAALQ